MEHASPARPAVEGAWIDDETGLPGAAVWGLVLGVEAARCRRYGRTATVVAVGIEGAEEISSAWGSEIAVRASRVVGSALAADVRSSDFLTRSADGTFLILLPETDEVAAVNFVERVRPRCDAALSSLRVPARCAFGWADVRGDRDLLAAADVARDRVGSDIATDA